MVLIFQSMLLSRPPPSIIEGERSTPTVEGEQHDSTSQGEHVNSSKETMGDDNFNNFNGPSGASPTSDNQQLVDVSGIIQKDMVEVVSTEQKNISFRDSTSGPRITL